MFNEVISLFQEKSSFFINLMWQHLQISFIAVIIACVIGLIMGAAMFALVGVLLVEMPDHLSIIQHIQMWYNYRYKQPKEYFYIPKERTHGTVKTNFDEDSKEWIEYQNMIQENRLSNEN